MLLMSMLIVIWPGSYSLEYLLGNSKIRNVEHISSVKEYPPIMVLFKGLKNKVFGLFGELSKTQDTCK